MLNLSEQLLYRTPVNGCFYQIYNGCIAIVRNQSEVSILLVNTCNWLKSSRNLSITLQLTYQKCIINSWKIPTAGTMLSFLFVVVVFVLSNPRGTQISKYIYCVKSDRIRRFPLPYFVACRLNTEICWVNLYIQSKCGKIRTRKTPNMDIFYTVMVKLVTLKILLKSQKSICVKFDCL